MAAAEALSLYLVASRDGDMRVVPLAIADQGRSETELRLLHQNAPAGGAGLEYLFSDRLGATVLRIWIDEDRALYALGTPKDLQKASSGLATRFLEDVTAQMEAELASLREQVESLALQLTHSLEELRFLRELAELLDLQKLGLGTWDIAARIGPVLHMLLQCEALLFLKDSEELQCTLAFGTVSDLHALETLWLALRQRADEQKPVISNKPDPEMAHRNIRSYLAVSMARGAWCCGWMVAINSTSPDGFGTVEASLMQTAATVLAIHSRNLALLKEKEDFLVQVVQALVCAIEAKDRYTSGHSCRVALMARRIAQQMGLSEEQCEQIYLAGLLHDVGKIGISDAVLRKEGRLTEEEFLEVQKHPVVGYRILERLQQLAFVLPGVLHHHERVDGKGYPAALPGSSIPLMARILAVADAYDAMVSDRPYRTGMPHEKVEQILRQGRGTQWDARVVDAFFEALPDIRAICTQSANQHFSFEDLRAISSRLPPETSPSDS